MNISKALEIGKAGQHLVCYDLIMNNYVCFLSDEGLNYDIVLDLNGDLKRIQVKSTLKAINYRRSKNIYRFGVKRAKRNGAKYKTTDIDIFAFAFLDIKKVAYVPVDMIIKNSHVIQIIEFRTKDNPIPSYTYPNGTVRYFNKAKFVEDYQDLSKLLNK